MKYKEFFFIIEQLQPGERGTTVLIKCTDEFHAKFLTPMFKTTTSKKVHILFIFHSELAPKYLNAEYSILAKELADYLNYTLYAMPIAEDNRYLILSKDWYSRSYAKDLDLYVDKLQALWPKKSFSYTVLPYYMILTNTRSYNHLFIWNIFPHADMPIISLNSEYTPIYCPVGAYKSDISGLKIKHGELNLYQLDLDFIQNLDLSKYSKILLVFVYSGYEECFFEEMDVETMGNYDTFRKHLADYIEHRLYDTPLIQKTEYYGNYFEEINKYWYDMTKGRGSQPVTRQGRELIDQAVLELQIKYPNKSIKYIVLPYGRGQTIPYIAI